MLGVEKTPRPDEPQLVRTSTVSKGLLARVFWSFLLVVFWAPLGSESQALSSDSLMTGLHGWRVTPVFTVGERLPTTDQTRLPHHYRPVGVLDGIGAFRLNRNTVRVLVNHELAGSSGYPYALKNGTELRGARISFLDMDQSTRSIVHSGMAFHSVVDRQGRIVTAAQQINQAGQKGNGFSRFCSATLLESETYGFVDRLYLVGEEVGDPVFHPYGGSLWVLDVERRVIHGVAATGRMNFENIAPLDIQGGRVAMLIGDDTIPQVDSPEFFGQEATVTTPPSQVVAAPLWLYIGKKNVSIFEIRKPCHLESNLQPTIY